MPNDPINNRFEKSNVKAQGAIERYIESLFDELVTLVLPLVAANAPKNAINRKVNEELLRVHKKITARIEVGMQNAWQLSNKKFTAYLDKRLKNTVLPEKVTAVWYDPNEAALKQFQERKVKGLNLSERIWKRIEPSKQIINQIIDEGIEQGLSHAKIAKELRSQLKNPEGSKTPGKGVYKSPIKNAKRVGRNEINTAYRSADEIAWNKTPLVIGQEIRLSNSLKIHARCEICRGLAGVYPKDFKWQSWHVNCMCYKIPILMNDVEFSEFQNSTLRGEEYTPKSKVNNMPAAFNKWVIDNNKRVAGWKSQPVWWGENKPVITKVLK